MRPTRCFRRPSPLRLVELESRQTPATLVSPTTLTYQDVDGDNATVKLSKPLLTSATVAGNVFTFDTGAVNGDNSHPQQLQSIDLTQLPAGAATGVSVTVTATRSPTTGGDGFAAVGLVNATGINLGSVTIHGDLGRILAGTGSASTPALTALTIQSLGRFGTSTQPAGGNLTSTVTSSLGALTIKGDVDQATVDVTTTIGSITVGGSLIGGTNNQSGQIGSGGNIGKIKVSGDLAGGAGADTGEIDSGGAIAQLTVGGSLRGTAAADSGEIFSRGVIGPVTIGGSLFGGAGDDSGGIDAGGSIGNVTVGGSLIGGGGFDTGEVLSGGSLGMLTVGGDLVGGSQGNSGDIDVNGAVAGVKVGGSLIGGAGSDSGEVLAGGNIGLITIGGGLFGGSGPDSGAINGGKAVAGVTVGGSLVGGSGNDTGEILVGTGLGPTTVRGDLRGGAGSSTGDVTAGTISSISVGGSVVGGVGNSSGVILGSGAIGSVAIGHDLVGGSISGASLGLDSSGYIQGQRIGRVAVGGSVIAGSNTSAGGTLAHSGAIQAVDDLGPVTVKGNLVGDPTNPVVISARGRAGLPVTTTIDLAIASLTVGGRVERALILAGYDVFGNPVNGQASIGAVKVGGDWVASSLVAGAMSLLPGFNFGTATDTEIGGLEPSEDRIAQIASITIGGQAIGTVGGTDHFGFVAERVGSLSVGGTVIPLHAGPSNDGLTTVGPTGDLTVFEVA
jgi:hypothetical protein